MFRTVSPDELRALTPAAMLGSNIEMWPGAVPRFSTILHDSPRFSMIFLDLENFKHMNSHEFRINRWGLPGNTVAHFLYSPCLFILKAILLK
jgi:hypothetical protein